MNTEEQRHQAAVKLASAVEEIVMLYSTVKYGQVNEGYVARALREALISWQDSNR